MEYGQIIFEELPSSELEEIQEGAQAGYVVFGPDETNPEEVRELALVN